MATDERSAAMNFRAGYACVNLDTPGKYRTCRQSNLTREVWESLIRANLGTLREMALYNQKHRLSLYRISSDLIPFGSAEVLDFDWAAQFAPEFAELKKLLRRTRFSMHPGQYTVLSSPDEGVIRRSILDLEYHVKVLQLLGATRENKLVIHIGGVYGDKPAAMERFVNTANALAPPIREHLILENDERMYHIADLLAIGQKTGLPVIFDNLHHQINPPPEGRSPAEWIDAVGATWQAADGRQIIHYSEQAPGKRAGAHSEAVTIDAFLDFINGLSRPIDIRLEVKDKNRSAEKVRMVLYKDIRLAEIIWARSKYSVLAKSQPIYQEIRRLLKAKEASDFLQIARLLESAQALPPSNGDAINAAEHVWGYFKDRVTTKERETFLEAIRRMQAGEITDPEVRKLLRRMLRKYPHPYLEQSYYFDQAGPWGPAL